MKRIIRRHISRHEEGETDIYIQDIVFGIQDGMISTLGALAGIAAGSENHFFVILSGFVIIAVESVSMGVGSYISNVSEEDIEKYKLDEEAKEIKTYRKDEEKELEQLYVHDGWPEPIAGEMAETAAKDPNLMLKEMAYRELHISPERRAERKPIKDGIFMFFAYILGGMVPLIPYFFSSVTLGIYISMLSTLVGLFLLGVFVTRFTKQNWIQVGTRMIVLGGTALVVGYYIGNLAII